MPEPQTQPQQSAPLDFSDLGAVPVTPAPTAQKPLDFSDLGAVPVTSTPGTTQPPIPLGQVPSLQPPAIALTKTAPGAVIPSPSAGKPNTMRLQNKDAEFDKAAGDEALGMLKSLPNMIPGVAELRQYPQMIQDYEAARQQGKGMNEAAAAAMDAHQKRNDVLQGLKQRFKEFSTNPDAATGRAIVDAIPWIIGGAFGGAEVAPEEAGLSSTMEAAAPEVAEAAVKPGIVKQVIQGEKVAQPQAQEALRQAANVKDVVTAQPQSLRELVSEPIDSLTAKAKASYRTIDDAAGTDFKALNEKLENTEYQIRNLTETEEDLAKEAQLEKSRQGIVDKIAEAKQTAIDNGVDPKILDEADQQFTQAQALKDVEARVFKNPSVVKGNVKFKTPETVDVDAAIKTLQKLQDNEKYGAPRLEQALGKDGANGLLNDLYEAQRTGQTALKRQQVAKMVAKYTMYAGGLTAGGHIIHALVE